MHRVLGQERRNQSSALVEASSKISSCAVSRPLQLSSTQKGRESSKDHRDIRILVAAAKPKYLVLKYLVEGNVDYTTVKPCLVLFHKTWSRVGEIHTLTHPHPMPPHFLTHTKAPSPSGQGPHSAANSVKRCSLATTTLPQQNYRTRF